MGCLDSSGVEDFYVKQARYANPDGCGGALQYPRGYRCPGYPCGASCLMPEDAGGGMAAEAGHTASLTASEGLHAVAEGRYATDGVGRSPYKSRANQSSNGYTCKATTGHGWHQRGGSRR